VPTNLIEILPIRNVGACGAPCWAPGAAGAVGAVGVWAEIGIPPATSKPRQKKSDATLCTGLRMKVFKAGNISKESEFQFSYRAVSLLGND